MSLAASFVRYEEVAAALITSTPGATPEKVDGLLATLLDQGFLFSELWPPVTHTDPARYVLEKLDGIPEAADRAAILSRFCGHCRPLGSGKQAYRRPETFLSLSSDMEAVNKAGGENPLQVDAAISVSGGLSRVVASEVSRAAEMLIPDLDRCRTACRRSRPTGSFFETGTAR